jgi:dynein heavy chain
MKEVKLPKDIDDILSNCALFSVIWGIGGALEETTRKGYNELITKMITAAFDIPEQFHIQAELKLKFEPRDIKAKIPDKTSIFELCYDKLKNTWPNWT